MKTRRTFLLLFGSIVAAIGLYGTRLISHGLNTAYDRFGLGKVMAGAQRNLAIPRNASYANGPKLSFLRTHKIAYGESRYIITDDKRITGMPGWTSQRDAHEEDSRQGIRFIFAEERFSVQEQEKQLAYSISAHYEGSQSCQKCHAQIYDRWRKTPMANVVRDPRKFPDTIIPDLATNSISRFTKDQVALVYGSIWKQRNFTKRGDDYFPEPAQWDITKHVWKPYFVANGTDWWAMHYPPDNMQRPTGPTCDGCHSMDYDIHTKQVAEWNVGCERCHGPGSEHAEHPSRGNILNPKRMDYVQASDTCIQCHSQGRPLKNPIEGKYYDWPVGYHVGSSLRDYWELEDHKLGETTFTHFPEGTAHKNRMQGNDFVQSVMYRRGVTGISCHDVHGTDNYAELKKPADQLCLDCHGPLSRNGPRTRILEEHTHHKVGSAGSRCIACHMPKIATEIADVKVRAHTFAFISPAMTERYKIPNPCTSCHSDKTTAWATDVLRHWPERSPWRMD